MCLPMYAFSMIQSRCGKGRYAMVQMKAMNSLERPEEGYQRKEHLSTGL